MKQTKTNLRLANILFVLLLGIIVLTSCTSNREEITPSAEYAPYINAYTGGIISQNSAIRIELTHDLPIVDLNNELKKNPFDFSPSLKGKAYWTSNNTIEFMPENGALQPGKTYEATFQLSRFVEVDKPLRKFKFSFRVQERNFILQTEALTITNNQPDKADIRGELQFSDAVNLKEVKKMLSAEKEKGETLAIDILPTDNPTRFLFQLNGIPRKERDYRVLLKANGPSIGIDNRKQIEIVIPALDSFRFLTARRIELPENGIEIVFSNPVSTTQDLKGLIDIPQIASSTFQVMENKVQFYFEANQLNKITLNIHKGIKDSNDKFLNESKSIAFSEINLKPEVKIASSSAILPNSKNLLIPFRAVNLYAVDLSVVRIYESNVLTFMQNNTLSGSNELRRCGRLVYKKTLWLAKDKSKDIHRWNDYSIDLAGLIRQEPGAIYRIILSFNQEYSAYPCNGNENRQPTFSNETAGELIKLNGTGLTEEEKAEWDIPYSYFYYSGGIKRDWNQYDWKERNNPCHPSYYMDSDKAAYCNVYASNIGMTVKQNSQNKLWIAVNNILDTAPIKDATVTAYNFQLQPIGTEKTNSNGFAEIIPKGIPFILVAEWDTQKTYVRVAEGEELSVSRFDVGGKEIQKGLKGFIYGERGVWRPGDTLHVSFILEDREKRIPDKHPVTLEMYNPQGQFYTKLLSTKGLNGFYTFNVPTRQDDPTGVWNAYIKVGGTSFHKSLRIETVKPNRLKINLKLPQKVIQASDKEIPVTLSSSWLTGATASGLKAKVELSLSKVNTQFKNYSQYIFNNPSTEFTTMQTNVFSGNLNPEGNTQFTWKLPNAIDAPGMLNATLITRVFEPGGDASIYSQTVPFSPFSSYVGINPNLPKEKTIETDKEHRFDIVTVNSQGELTNRTHIEYKIYRIEWSWWWENRNESWGTYINNSTIIPVASGQLRTVNGKASFTFRINYPDWGRYLIYVKDRESGHATGSTVCIDWPEWRGRSNKVDPSGIQMLAFALDKESYEIGETATAIIPVAAGGRALVTIENGSTVLQREWIEVSNREDTKYTFKITPEMAPNVYLHISLLQPHAQTINDLPIRMYGVIPISVTNKQTILQPEIRMPEVLRPETEFNVIVSEKSGKPMTYTLAIVDDGLLDLTGFKTPDPWNEFYSREALGIRTWDIYDEVIGAFAGRYASLFSTGGDEMLKPADNKANRFKPIVKFVGPFHIGKGKQQTHTFKLPMYVGSIRAMVIAGEEGAYGKTEKSAYVRTPLMLLSTLPRVLSTQEEIDVPVNVFAMEEDVKNIKVSIQAQGAGVQVTGATQQSVTFNQPGDQLIYFKIKTSNNTGKVTIRLTANGGGKNSHEYIELEVRNPNPIVTLHSSQWIEAGESAMLPFELKGENHGKVSLEVSRIPSVDISRRFDFLYNYQHHCTEQLTSKALPLLFIQQFKAVDNDETEKIKSNIQEGIRILYSRQLPNGGFSYWPGDATADEWITSYVGMFLVLAQEKGYAINQNILNKWKHFQRAAAQNWRMPQQENNQVRGQSSLQQAYRLYTLALAGVPEQGAMNRMKELAEQMRTESEDYVQSLWRLAAAYALCGKTKPAEELIFNLQHFTTPYSSLNTVYGSSNRDEAMILETLLLLKRKEAALEQARKVSYKLSHEEWFDTQSTAFSLMTMGLFAEQNAGTLDFTWRLNGKQQPAVKSAKAIFVQSLPTTTKNGSIELKNQGQGGVNANLTTQIQLLKDTLPAISNNLRVDVAYTSMNGTPISVTDLQQGMDFISIVTVSNISGISDYQNLALTHILPTGWEIYNERLTTPGTTTPPYNYQDIRDDRVLTYFDLRRNESKRFTLRLQATYAGNFTLPAIQCEAMYDANVQARNKAGRTIIK